MHAAGNAPGRAAQGWPHPSGLVTTKPCLMGTSFAGAAALAAACARPAAGEPPRHSARGMHGNACPHGCNTTPQRCASSDSWSWANRMSMRLCAGAAAAAAAAGTRYAACRTTAHHTAWSAQQAPAHCRAARARPCAAGGARLCVRLRLRGAAADAPVAVHEHVAGEQHDDEDAQAEEDKGEVLGRLRGAPQGAAPVGAGRPRSLD